MEMKTNLSEKDRRISQRACQCQNKVYHISAAALQRYAFFSNVVFLSTKSFDGASHWHSATTQMPVNFVSFRLVSAACKVGRSRLPVLSQKCPSARPLHRRVYLHQSRAETSLYAHKNARTAVPNRKAL